MGQIVGAQAKCKRCNISAIRTGGSLASTVLASDEYVLVSSDNSMSGTGTGKFDCYIVGDGVTAASGLTVNQLTETDREPTAGSVLPVQSGGVRSAILANTSYGDDVSDLIGQWGNGKHTDYATFNLDQSGHNGTWSLLSSSTTLTRIRLSASNLTNGLYYRIKMDVVISDNIPLGNIGCSSIYSGEWSDLLDVQTNTAILFGTGHIDAVIQKTSDWEFFLVAHASSQGHSYPITVVVSNFEVSEYHSVNDVDETPVADSPKLVKSGGIKSAIDNVSFATGEKINGVSIDDAPSLESSGVMKSNGILNHEALMLLSVFRHPAVTGHCSIKKSDGSLYSNSSLTTAATDFIEIQEGCDVFVLGFTGSTQTAAALYSSNDVSSFIDAEQEKGFVHYTSEELSAFGAKYLRCTISSVQRESGEWFVIVKNTSDEISSLYSNIDNNYIPVIEKTFSEEEKEQARLNIGAASKYDLSIFNNIDLSKYTLSQWSINSSNLWVQNSGSGQVTRTKFIPIEAGKSYHIYTVLTAIIAILKDDNDKVKGESPNFSTSYEGRISIEAGGTFDFTCPNDATVCYLLITSTSGDTNVAISEVSDIKDSITILDYKVNELEGIGSGDSANLSSIRRIADSKGNELTPLSITVDENGYEIPTTREVLNVQKKSRQMTDIVWTPLADIPYHGTGGVFPANIPVTGLPYSSVKEIDKYIGFDVSIHTFMTALNNPYSLLYTECVLGTKSASAWGRTYHGVNQCSAYYGTVCSVLTGYCTGQVVQWSTEEDRWCAERNFNMVKVYNQSAQGLHIGDIIWISGHNRLVVGLKRDADGNVTYVQIVESTGAHARQNNDITAASFNSNLATERGGGIIYRNIELYKNTYTPSEFVAVGDETITPYVYNDDICTFAGDKATFRENDLIVLNYNLKSTGAWTAIEVYKDNALLSTYALSSITQSELPESQMYHALNLGNSHSYGMYKARLTDGVNYSDYTYWEVLETEVGFSKKTDETHHITWSSSNGTPLSFTICNISGTVFAHNELTIENLRDGYLDIDLNRFNSEQYPDSPFGSGMYLKIHFQGEYGRSTNQPLSITI